MENNVRKSLYDVFKRYVPAGSHKDIFDCAEVTKTLADREKKIVEVRLSLDRLFRKSDLYSLEKELEKTYELKTVRLLPHYPAELFDVSYLSEVLREADRLGAVVNGFFYDMVPTLRDGVLDISIPFNDGGMFILDFTRTKEAIERIIKNEFSLDVTVNISQFSDYTRNYREFEQNQKKALETENDEIVSNYKKMLEEEKAAKQKEKEEKEDPFANLKKVRSLFDRPGETGNTDGSLVTSGKMTFDVSEPVQVLGRPFDVTGTLPISEVNGPQRDVIVLGQVFDVSSKETRRGDKTSITISVTDNASSLFIRTVVPSDGASEVLDSVKTGECYAFRGNVKIDSYDNEPYLQFTDIEQVRRIRREDNSEDKRVELHLHTCMSSMDALPTAEDVVKTANRWGHGAVAITDHGNLQSFPTAMLAAEKINKDGGDFKVIYGLEAYYVDDTMRAAYKGDETSFEDEFVVFDIETTGLSPISCKIIEIGAVITKNGEVLSKYNTFVNPGVPIPQNITELTGIDDGMVKDAPTIDKVLPEFLEYCGGRMLIAHNASFDTSFIRTAAEELGIPFTNPYLDTVALSRYLNPGLKNHKLDTVAAHYKLGDFNHHRASDDAEMLALIFGKMIERMSEEGIFDVSRLSYVMSENADPLKLKTYHQIILVKNQLGLKNLYKLVSDSYLRYFRRFPRIPKTRLEELRDGLLIGSACEAGELFRALLENRPDADLDEIASFYDYIEIQPISNNRFLVDEGTVADDEGLRDLNRRLIQVAKRVGKPVVATTDAHYLDPEDDIYRRILLSGQKYKDADRENKLYFRTTEEMLEEFAYLGEETAREVVIDNPRKIADMIEKVRPIPEGKYDPHIDGANEELTESCYKLAHELYGDPLPEEVASRLDKELKSIIGNGFAIMYIIARKLVLNSESKGYQVGSRGSVGSSFVATMSGITRVNPLPPHYRCQKCKKSDFTNPTGVKSGFDLPEKKCPDCGVPMERDGHDIPFETFLGFKGDKVPDIDLNFSGDVQADAHKFTEVLFGEGHAFRAGTIGTLANKTAYGIIIKYLEEKGIMLGRAEIERLISGCVGVKRTTGQHPGGIIIVPQDYEVYDFCPVQHPADDPNSSVITTHFEFKYLHDTILKLDILGHDIPTKYKRLEEYSGTSVLDVPMSDPEVYKLFTSPEPLGVNPKQIFSETGTLGLPEMGTRFIRGVLMESRPNCFADLLQISGLTHGTDVWIGNADELIRSKTCTIKDVIGCRDDIMLVLIHEHGIENKVAFDIMESVRKGRGLKPEFEQTMREHNVPDWYIDSCKKIKYMFPKAHAAAYVMDALRLGWYKINYPVVFYAAYFSAAPDGFNAEIVMGGREKVLSEIDRLSKLGNELTQKEGDTLDALYLVNEYLQRGYDFLPVKYDKSDAHKFIPENGMIRLPFDSLPGVGTSAAESIASARESGRVYSVADLQQISGITKAVLEVLERNGVIDGMPKTDQYTLF